MLYQLNIYTAGTQSIKPSLPVSFCDLEKKAREVMPPEAFDYIAGGAGAGSTILNNRAAFDQWQIVPRMMGDVSARDTSVEIFNMSLPTPFLLAPVGVLSIVHKEAELAVARAAGKLRIPQIVSNVSSNTLENIAAENADNLRWFQLYWGSNNEFTKSILLRAENAGYKAIVVTLDTRIFAWRERDIQNAYLPFLYNEGLANYLSDPVFLSLTGDPAKDNTKTLMTFASCFSNPSSTWEDLRFLKDCTSLPLIVKGILHPDDAKKALDNGADGIIVSNHGGRQIDGGIGALDALPGVADAVGHETTILFDSSIRTGADVFKAMALGAKAVLIGRPYAYALAINGEKGVEELMLNLSADTELTLGLAGKISWKDTNPDCLTRASPHSQ